MQSQKKRKLERLTQAAFALQDKAQKRVHARGEEDDEDYSDDENAAADEEKKIEEETPEQSATATTDQGATVGHGPLAHGGAQHDLGGVEDVPVGEDDDTKHDLKYEEDFDDEYEEEDVVDEEELKKPKGKVKPFLGSVKNLKQGEELVVNNRAYEMLHRANTEWPCLSMDFLLPLDQMYNIRQPVHKELEKYPLQAFIVAGTQTDSHQTRGRAENYIYLMKWSKLHKTKHDDDSDYQDSDDDGTQDEDAQMDVQLVRADACVNRIKTMQHMPIVAYWCENGDVCVMDIKQRFQLLGGDPTTDGRSIKNPKCPVKIFRNQSEGFALDWNPLRMGQLASGSCDGKVYVYNPSNNSFSDIIRDERPYEHHRASVEDIQWSPENEYMFASCSVDKTIQIVDARASNKKKSQLLIQAHDTDVNVISWCKKNPNLIASGADDGCFKVWDRRYTRGAYTENTYHKQAITSIEFQPNDDCVLAVASADDRLTIWDLSAENDDTTGLKKPSQIEQETRPGQKQKKGEDEDDDDEIPDQLMFMHQGQQELKELHYHPVYYEVILATAANGLHLFKPALDDESALQSQADEEEEENGPIPEINEKDLDKMFGKMNLEE